MANTYSNFIPTAISKVNEHYHYWVNANAKFSKVKKVFEPFIYKHSLTCSWVVIYGKKNNLEELKFKNKANKRLLVSNYQLNYT